MSIFSKQPRPVEMMLGEASTPFSVSVASNVKINKYAKFDPYIACGLKVMSVFTN